MANPVKAAAGTVLEAHLDKRVGAIATLLVQTGTLHVGDVVVAGSAYGKVGFSWCSPSLPVVALLIRSPAVLLLFGFALLHHISVGSAMCLPIPASPAVLCTFVCAGF